MQYPIAIQTNFGRFRAKVYNILKWPYLVFTLCAYVFIGLIVFLYLDKAPTYKSELELVLPGTGASASVSLDNVGQVVSQTSAPFSAGGFNPRVNYKEMLLSRGVLNLASDKTSLSAQGFGQPKIALTIQTSILAVSITGLTAKQAELALEEIDKEIKEFKGRMTK